LDVANGQARLFERTSHALKWNYAGNAVRTLLQLGIGILLARLVGPEAYGEVAVAWLVIGVGMMFSDVGFGTAIVQRRSLSEQDVRFVFTVQVCVGAALSLAGVALADVVAGVMRQPGTAPVVRGMALLFVLQSFGQTALATMRRTLDFKGVQSIAIASYLGPYVLVGIPCAYLGYGAWSLVAAQLLQAAVASALALRQAGLPVRPTLRPDSPGLFTFGGKVIAANLSYWGITSLDSVIVGRALGTADLGLYYRASTLVMNPMYALTTAMHGVLLSYCSRAQDDLVRLKRAWLAATLAVAVVCLPVFATIAVVPETVVAGLLGEEWTPAAQVLRPLALAAALSALLSLVGPVLTAMDRVAVEVRAQLVTLALMVPALHVAAGSSARAVAWAVLAMCVVRLLLLVAPLLKLLQASWGDGLGVLAWPAACAVAIGAPTWCVDRLLEGAPPAARLAAVLAAAAASMLATARLLGGRVLGSRHAAFLLAEDRVPAALRRFLRV
jgi:PST family polysaccharide transporter